MDLYADQGYGPYLVGTYDPVTGIVQESDGASIGEAFSVAYEWFATGQIVGAAPILYDAAAVQQSQQPAVPVEATVSITDGAGHIIGDYDPKSGLGYAYSATDQTYVTQVSDQLWAAQGRAAITQIGSVIKTASTTPPAIPPAGWVPGSVIQLPNGQRYTYGAARNPATGQLTYTPVPASSGGIFGNMSPMLLVGIGAVALIALTSKRGK